MYFTYILKSKRDNSFYYGSTKDLSKRLVEYNKGKVRYTKGHIHWILHYFEKFESRAQAIRREIFFKSIDGYSWLKQNNIT
ncbi:endonuclease [bacterium]|nr:endonuclease [bacterium]